MVPGRCRRRGAERSATPVGGTVIPLEARGEGVGATGGPTTTSLAAAPSAVPTVAVPDIVDEQAVVTQGEDEDGGERAPLGDGRGAFEPFANRTSHP